MFDVRRGWQHCDHSAGCLDSPEALEIRASVWREMVRYLLDRGIDDFQVCSGELSQEIITESFRSLRKCVTDNELRVLCLGILLGKEVICHLRTHASQTDEACALDTRSGSLQLLKPSNSGPHQDPN